MNRTMLSLFLAFLLLAGCNNEAGTKRNTKDSLTIIAQDTVPTVIVGNDIDEHGCKASAGYQWSMIKKECIRMFESGIKMEPKDASLDKNTVAYLIISDDRVKVEIFLPTQKKSVVIRKTSADNEPERWLNGPLSITLLNGTYTLYDDTKLLYQGVAK